MRKNVVVTIIVFVLLIGVVLLKIAPSALTVSHEVSRQVSKLVFHREELLKQTDGRTNILLLGIGGGTHDGPDLTDTVIFASIIWKQNRIALVSIPRDLWIPDRQEKINAVYSDGEAKQKGEGLKDAESMIAKVTGQPIHYGFRIDFGGFVKAVDELGGLDINVDNTFDDYIYPITGKEDDSCSHSDTEITDFVASHSAETDLQQFFPCRYKHLHFDAGQQHMDGETALEYVRSRHALGPEGSDFSRSKRQAKVIAAVKAKVFSLQTFLDPAKILSLIGILKDSIDTDIPQTDIALFVDQLQKLKSSTIQDGVLDLGDEAAGRAGLLINPTPSADYNFAWVLIPKTGSGDYSDIQKYISCEVTSGNCIVTDEGIKTATSSAK